MQASDSVAKLFIELGAAVLGLAILARLANRWGFSAIPLYLLAGLAFGKGGLTPLNLSEEFIHVGAEIGVLLLLFMLGLEYTGNQLKQNLRKGLPVGAVDLLLNFPPGLAAGLLMGWTPLAAVLLGGITYISSSGVIAKLLTELKWLHHPETPALLSVLVLEDLAMAVYLPVVAVLLTGAGTASLAVPVLIALAVVLLVLWIAVGYGPHLSRLAAHESDEIILLTAFGTVLLVAGIAQRLHVSAAIGAFLVGIAASSPIAEQSHRVLAPMRDLFAAMFFFFFGLQINPSTLPAALPAAVALGVVTAFTKILTGYWTARLAGVAGPGRWRAGIALIARGEFSIVIAGLGTSLEPRLEPLAAAYVLLLAILGPVAARVGQATLNPRGA